MSFDFEISRVGCMSKYCAYGLQNAYGNSKLHDVVVIINQTMIIYQLEIHKSLILLR